ncbi:MAG: pre-peptidase C-terminal domain-containing protein [Candidatus Omnitrophica bacterium]|nr:pre-peptidase C-terminal domain-containing protein [Candidatus Omnitrophota bacterium]
MDRDNSLPFNDFDLYAMGLLGPDEVAPSFVIDNPRTLDGRPLVLDSVSGSYAINPDGSTEEVFVVPGYTVLGRRRDVSIEDILAIEAPRAPPHPFSQKDFSVGFVVVNDPEGDPTEEEDWVEGLNGRLEIFQSAWDLATRYRSGISILPTSVLKDLAPELEFLSPLFTRDPNYTLVYSIDGVEKRESVSLTEEKTTFVREATGVNGKKRVASFTVTLLEDNAPAVENGYLHTQTFSKSSPVANETFATDVVLVGGNVVVGVPNHKEAGVTREAVYIYSGSTGELLKKILAPSGAIRFGDTLAVSGTQLAVGAPFASSLKGAVYLYDVDSASPTFGNLLLTLSNPTPANFDRFGDAIAFDGDRLVVGAPGDNEGATDAGVVHVFDTTTGNLIQTILNPNPATSDEFGSAVAIQGQKVLVGAKLDDADAQDAGSAYLFDSETGELLHTFSSPDPEKQDNFGEVVKFLGTKVLVSAPAGDTWQDDSGLVYVFEGDPDSPEFGEVFAELTSPGPRNGEKFGQSIAVSGDRLFIGAKGPINNPGVVYAFEGDPSDERFGKWVQTLFNPTAASSEEFGSAIAAEGGQVVIGDFRDGDSGADSAGAAYLFETEAAGLVINQARPYTNVPQVVLELRTRDAISMAFSEDDGETFTDFEPFRVAKVLALTGEDGVKTVTVRYQDQDGNLTDFEDSILLDTQAPTGSLDINSGAAYTQSRNVTATVTASDETSRVHEVRIKFQGQGGTYVFTWPYGQTTKNYSVTLPAGDGEKTATLTITDVAGNTSESILDTITLDTTAPTGSVVINDDDEFTTSQDVTLTLTSDDVTAGVDQVRFSTDGGTTWTDWEDPADTKDLTLPAGDGQKEVQYEVKDKAGNTEIFSDTIILDLDAPTGTILINDGDEFSTSQTVTLTLTQEDLGSGVKEVRYKVGEGDWSDWEEAATTKEIELDDEDGEQTVYYEIKDKVDRTSETYSDTIILDREAPSTILNSRTVVNHTKYLLNYTLADNIDSERTFTEQITLIQGSNSISRTFTDRAGNSRTVTWTITFLPVDTGHSTAYDASFVPFDWVTTSTATGVTELDDAESFTLPFTFRFFGTDYTEIQITSKGFIQFGSCSGCIDWSPDVIPNSKSPNRIAAALWRDLDPSEAGEITYLSSADQFVVTWDNVPNYDDSVAQRFQLILEAGGALIFQYDTVTAGPVTEVGLEDSAGTGGIRYTLLPVNDTAVKFTPVAGAMYVDVLDGDYVRSGIQIFQEGNEHQVTFSSDLQDPDPDFSWQWSYMLDGNETVASSGTGAVQDLVIDFGTKAAGAYEVILTGDNGVDPLLTLTKTLEVLPGTWSSNNTPPLSSDYATLFLDFNGSYVSEWGSYSDITTPPYDRDGVDSSFNDGEQLNIAEIWQRLIEKFIIFGVWVTALDPFIPTQEYPTLADEWEDRDTFYTDNRVLAAMIGGDGSWYGTAVGGLAYVNSFTNFIENLVYIMADNLGGDPKYTAEATAHETGHGFGLQHQSTYDTNGNKTREYNPGTSVKAPIMGSSSYLSQRGLWWNGTSSTCSTCIQNDITVIARSQNGFGYRPDDHGDDSDSASELTIHGTAVSAAGIIGSTDDKDYFTFTTTSDGEVSFMADVAIYGTMLDLSLFLYDSDGNTVASADTTSLEESFSDIDLTAGTYYLAVKSKGSYGDVGQYAITGTVPSGTSSSASGLVAVSGTGSFNEGAKSEAAIASHHLSLPHSLPFPPKPSLQPTVGSAKPRSEVRLPQPVFYTPLIWDALGQRTEEKKWDRGKDKDRLSLFSRPEKKKKRVLHSRPVQANSQTGSVTSFLIPTPAFTASPFFEVKLSRRREN